MISKLNEEFKFIKYLIFNYKSNIYALKERMYNEIRVTQLYIEERAFIKEREIIVINYAKDNNIDIEGLTESQAHLLCNSHWNKKLNEIEIKS